MFQRGLAPLMVVHVICKIRDKNAGCLQGINTRLD